MKLKVLTTDKVVVDQEVDSVTLPGTEGQMTILPHHAAMVATLQKGKVIYRQHGRFEPAIHIVGGVVEVLKDTVLVMTKVDETLAANPSHH